MSKVRVILIENKPYVLIPLEDWQKYNKKVEEFLELFKSFYKEFIRVYDLSRPLDSRDRA